MADSTQISTVSRRTLTGIAAAGVGVPLLAACGADDSSTASDTPSSSAASSAPAGSTRPAWCWTRGWTGGTPPATDAGATTA